MRSKAGLIYNAVETIAVAMCLFFITTLFKEVSEIGKIQASHSTAIQINTERLMVIEAGGSPGLKAHVREDDSRFIDLKDRVVKLEAAILGMSSLPSKIDNISEGQHRIEKMIEEHMNRSKP